MDLHSQGIPSLTGLRKGKAQTSFQLSLLSLPCQLPLL